MDPSVDDAKKEASREPETQRMRDLEKTCFGPILRQ